MFELVVTATTAAAAAFAVTPLANRIGRRLGLMDIPGHRRIHDRPIARSGGVAVFVGLWLAVAIWGELPAWGALLTGSSVIFVLGLCDDRWELGPLAKLAGQIGAAVVFAVWGARIEFVSNPFGEGMFYVGAWGIPLTVGWLVAVSTMLNNIDGLDGLAAGVTGIACVPLAVIALNRGDPAVALVAAGLAGSVVGFLPYNFNPARILLGDSGALVAGFLLGALSVEGALKGATAMALSIPILILGLPAFDTTWAVVRRFRARRPVYQADQEHVHHRLLALGLTQRQAVLTLYLVCAYLAVASVYALGQGPVHALWSLAALCVCLGLALRRSGEVRRDVLARGRSSR